jgi:hypothetical protein
MPDPEIARSSGARVIDLGHARPVDRRPKPAAPERVSRCTKCTSTFIEHEPAFVHCKYCGNMMRVAGALFLEQDTYEMRSGLRSIDAIAAGFYG